MARRDNSDNYDSFDEFEEHGAHSAPGAPDTWVPDEAIAGLVMERRVLGDESQESQARRIFSETAAAAAASICHMAVHGTNERLRLDAAKYVVERVLGKAGDDPFVKNPVDELINSVTKYVEDAATTATN